MVSTACGPFQFSSDFDSGNFLKVELLEHPRKAVSTLNLAHVDYEVNLWTRPDCFGTVYENGNRTWFHFQVSGGKPHAMLKLNVLNLNKQTKLFHQGMQPVFRVLPGQPLWQRVTDRLIVNETLDHVCSISFRQRLPDDPKNSKLYFAFTYPYSYAESNEWLHRLETAFPGTLPSGFRFDRVKASLPSNAELSLVSAAVLPVENEIYFHRECVCYSYEGRIVDLITVTSLYGMSSEREERLANLFPVESQERPHRFPSKKVIFLSARVHPGETPSTFVLNGFLKFVLDRNDPRAILLRRMFVFKFIPMLNPDGVAKGHYRTDPRGVNLNRVYLNPSPKLHPSIYAARKLLLYYHFGHDTPDGYEYPTEEVSLAKCDQELGKNTELIVQETKELLVVEEKLSNQNIDGEDSSTKRNPSFSAVSVEEKEEQIVKENNSAVASTSSKKYTFVLSDANSLCAGCSIAPYESKKGKRSSRRKVNSIDKKKKRKKPKSISSSRKLKHLSGAVAGCSSSSVIRSISKAKSTPIPLPDIECLTEQASMDTDTVENVEVENRHHCAFEACDEDSVLFTSDAQNDIQADTQLLRRNSCPVVSMSENANDVLISESSSPIKIDVPRAPLFPKMKQKRTESRGATSEKVSVNSSSKINSPSSGLFLYVDMHGHATKRGIFMYGNHFPDATTQAETMLLPRLMAMNYQHFDFAACNFTERLMNMKDRRDGASREGSGRVACLKLTGLVRSYTLECNYNTGRLVNQIIQRPTSYGFTDPSALSSIHHCVRYTPEIFEEAGKALAESVLDLTGQNPFSRIKQTEFKSLDGMRRWMLNRLYHSPEYSFQARSSNLLTVLSKDKISARLSSAAIKRQESSVLSSGSIPIVGKTKKRVTKKRSGTKVLAEIASVDSGTAQNNNDVELTIVSTSEVNLSSSSGVVLKRRSTLPHKLNFSAPTTRRSKDTNRR